MDEADQPANGNNTPQQEPNSAPAAPTVPGPSTTQPIVGFEESISEHREATQEPAEAPQNNLERRFSIFEGWMIGLTILGIVVAGITGVIFWRQLGVMNGQLAEMKSGSADTHDLAVAAKSQSQATETIAQAAKAQAIAAVSQVEKLEAGVKETHALAMEAKRSADIAGRSIEVQERPWVGVMAFSVKDDIVVGKTPSVSMTIQNNGRSPAIHTDVRLRMSIFCGLFPKSPGYPLVGSGSKTILMPGILVESGDTKFSAPLTEDFMKIARRDDCDLYAFGRITYDDTFGKSHWRHACVLWQKETPRSFVICSIYTDGDEDYPDGKEPN